MASSTTVRLFVDAPFIYADFAGRFMLLQVTPDGYKNMVVSGYPEMTQFLTSINFLEHNSKAGGTISVEFVGAGKEKNRTLEIPLRPDTAKLEPVTVNMYEAATQAFKMMPEYNEWFSACFSFEVVLVYLGDNGRGVGFEDLKQTKTTAWLSQIGRNVPFLSRQLPEDYQITFADCSPYLVVSKTSLQSVTARLPEGEEMDMRKFRPNIVLEGAANAWEEDYWGAINVNGADMILAHNCIRCQSINIDYETGKAGTGESGQVLKKLQKDRRVDVGAKWSPVFGRYSFWNTRHASRMLAVGDEVYITKVNKERTKWSWPTLG
jgi:uncharacterized protein YcbX